MRQQLAQIQSADGRFAASFLINSEGKAGIRLRLPRGAGLYDHKGLALPQAVAVVEVLTAALVDADGYRRSVRTGRYMANPLTKRRATNGRATALLRAFPPERPYVVLGIAKSANRFDHVDLRLDEASSVIQLITAVLRDAEAHRAGEGSPWSRS